MHWPSCHHDNRAERRFCVECGATLAARCAACGASNEPAQQFFVGRGAPLRAPAALPALATAVATASRPPPAHRHVPGNVIRPMLIAGAARICRCC